MQQVTNTILGQMRTAATCSTCSGSGKIVDQKPSGVGSDGLDRKEEVVSVKIPAGVQDGMQLRVYTAHCADDQASTPLFVKSERKVLQWL